MKRTHKNLLAVAGVILVVVGALISIPSFLSKSYPLAITCTLSVIIGLIFLAVAFGD